METRITQKVRNTKTNQMSKNESLTKRSIHYDATSAKHENQDKGKKMNAKWIEQRKICQQRRRTNKAQETVNDLQRLSKQRKHKTAIPSRGCEDPSICMKSTYFYKG